MLIFQGDDDTMKLRICRTTLWSLRKKGELKGFNVGGRVFYTKDEIVEYIERLRSNK